MVSLPSEQSGWIHCRYVNTTRQIQITRITNIANWYFERVVFPGQCLLFEALPYAQLEIHTYTQPSAILSDTIPCDRLRVNPLSQPGTSGRNTRQAQQPSGISGRNTGRSPCLATSGQSVCSRK